MTFDAMIRYVGAQVRNLSAQLTTFASQLDRHEQWHHDDLERQLREQRSNGRSTMGLVIQAVSVMVALVSVVVAIVALRH